MARVREPAPLRPDRPDRGLPAAHRRLCRWLAEITGYAAVSLQPNAGSQGEFAGLLAIRGLPPCAGATTSANVCLIPSSAHGTNAASAVMAGMRGHGRGLRRRGQRRPRRPARAGRRARRQAAALMVTYPSTHGVFEDGISEICAARPRAGGQVYMDGANLNAQVGVARPGDFGADVCHLNLHKTFCIPHGGGGPGVGPIGVARAPGALPAQPPAGARGRSRHRARAGLGGALRHRAGILPISWAYIRLMGAGRAAPGHPGGDPRRQLRRRAARASTTRSSTPA